MYYSNIKYDDIANGEGVRTSLFVSGCRNHCKGCFQPETWNFNNGYPFTKEIEDKIIKSLDHEYIQGLSLLGGDPFEPENAVALVPFLHHIKLLYPYKDIWAYSGYTLEKIKDMTSEKLLSFIDVLVDGPFELDKKDITLQFRGSSNQRIIDVNKTLRNGEIILWQ